MYALDDWEFLSPFYFRCKMVPFMSGLSYYSLVRHLRHLLDLEKSCYDCSLCYWDCFPCNQRHQESDWAQGDNYVTYPPPFPISSSLILNWWYTILHPIFSQASSILSQSPYLIQGHPPFPTSIQTCMQHLHCKYGSQMYVFFPSLIALMSTHIWFYNFSRVIWLFKPYASINYLPKVNHTAWGSTH